MLPGHSCCLGSGVCIIPLRSFSLLSTAMDQNQIFLILCKQVSSTTKCKTDCAVPSLFLSLASESGMCPTELLQCYHMVLDFFKNPLASFALAIFPAYLCPYSLHQVINKVHNQVGVRSWVFLVLVWCLNCSTRLPLWYKNERQW